MKLRYHPESDSLRIDLAEKPQADSREVAQGVMLAFDEDGQLVGIDVDQASRVVSWSRLEFSWLPNV